jgi:hypothetical protein
VDIHFLREKVKSSAIDPVSISSAEQFVDIFTKSVGPSTLCSTIVKLGLVDIFAPT